MSNASAPVGRVVIDLAPGEHLTFGDTGVEVSFIAKSGRAARLCITSPRSIEINRALDQDVRPKHAMMAATERG